MKKEKTISVVGLGKLGLCMAACFASKGYEVVGVDVDAVKIEKINSGQSPIDETGLDKLLKTVSGKLRATSDYNDAILNSDLTFIVVATPSLADGSFSNKYLEEALFEIAQVLKKKKDYHLVVVSSTVMPETVGRVARYILEEKSGKKCGIDFGIVYNPEFIALGSVIKDFLNPDLILIGEFSKRDGDALEEVYNRVCDNSPYFARMSTVNAEITKISLNCYITTKITFANSLAGLCEMVQGANAHVISDALGHDSRVGIKYIKPGLGYGGPCFPRDNLAFAAFARKISSQAKLAEAVDEVNRDQPERVLRKIKSIILKLNKQKKVKIGILGLSYKPNTSIVDESQALRIAQLLINEGLSVVVYDPQAQDNVRGVLGDSVEYMEKAEDCISLVDLVVIAVPWQEFSKINFTKIKKNLVVLDCWNSIKPVKGLVIESLGVSE